MTAVIAPQRFETLSARDLSSLRVLITTCGAALVLMLSSLAAAQTDVAREARWRSEVEPGIVVGDAVTLVAESDQRREFFAIFTDGKAKDTAIVLVHGVGVHPDFGLIGKLRVLLADGGYPTLSIQMPVRPKETTDGNEYVGTFPDSTARIASAAVWLKQKGYRRVVLVSHSMGAWMSNVYFQRTASSPYSAWIILGVTGRILPLGQTSVPVLDVYGENDLVPNLNWAWFRKLHLALLPESTQVMISGADHHYGGKEAEVARVILAFVDRATRH